MLRNNRPVEPLDSPSAHKEILSPSTAPLETPQTRLLIVTGCAGFLGSSLTARLLSIIDDSSRLLGLDCFTNFYSSALKVSRVEWLKKTFPRKFDFLPLDLNHSEASRILQETLEKFCHSFNINCLIVFHLAAQSSIPYCEKFPETLEYNILTTRNLLQGLNNQTAALARGGFVLASSSAADFLVSPSSSRYGLSKRMSELLLQENSANFPSFSLRFFNVYGPESRPDLLIARWIDEANRRAPMRLHVISSQSGPKFDIPSRDFTFIEDWLSALIAVNDHLGRLKSSYNHQTLGFSHQTLDVGSGHPHSILHVNQIIQRHFNRSPYSTVYCRYNQSNRLETHADPEPFQRLFDSLPATSIEKGIAQTLDYYHAHRPLFVVSIIATQRKRFSVLRRAISSMIQQEAQPQLALISLDWDRKQAGDGLDELLELTQLLADHQTSCGTIFLPILSRRVSGASGTWNSAVETLVELFINPQGFSSSPSGKLVNPLIINAARSLILQHFEQMKQFSFTSNIFSLSHLLAFDSIFLAFLDDDDLWQPNHIFHCLAALRRTGGELAASNFIRREITRNDTIVKDNIRQIPSNLGISHFLIGNLGNIQGSNLFVRLDTFLQCGLFDEFLSSCTDRDVFIRIIERGAVRVAQTHQTTVVHYADLTDQTRLSAAGSPRKLAGLTRFYQKHSIRMSPLERREFVNRSQKLFQWSFKEFSSVERPQKSYESLNASSSTPSAFPSPDLTSFLLFVGIISDNYPSAEDLEFFPIQELLQELLALSDRLTMFVLVLENNAIDDGDHPISPLASCINDFAARGLRVSRFTLKQQKEISCFLDLKWAAQPAAGYRLPIAQARTLLQYRLGSIALAAQRELERCGPGKPRVAALILDDDQSFNVRGSGGSHFLLRLSELSDAASQAGWSGMFGVTVDSPPPIPETFNLRTQLLDWSFQMRQLQQMKFQQDGESGQSESSDPPIKLPGSFYSSSHNQLSCYDHDLGESTEMLETPNSEESVTTHQTTHDKIKEHLNALEDILLGDVKTRLRTPQSCPVSSLSPSFHRGGITLVFDLRCLVEIPNVSPQFSLPGGRFLTARRSDMNWAFLQSACFQRRFALDPALCFVHRRSNQQRLKAKFIDNPEKPTSEPWKDFQQSLANKIQCDILGHASHMATRMMFDHIKRQHGPGIEAFKSQLCQPECSRVLLDSFSTCLTRRLALWWFQLHRVVGILQTILKQIEDFKGKILDNNAAELGPAVLRCQGFLMESSLLYDLSWWRANGMQPLIEILQQSQPSSSSSFSPPQQGIQVFFQSLAAYFPSPSNLPASPESSSENPNTPIQVFGRQDFNFFPEAQKAWQQLRSEIALIHISSFTSTSPDCLQWIGMGSEGIVYSNVHQSIVWKYLDLYPIRFLHRNHRQAHLQWWNQQFHGLNHLFIQNNKNPPIMMDDKRNSFSAHQLIQIPSCGIFIAPHDFLKDIIPWPKQRDERFLLSSSHSMIRLLNHCDGQKILLKNIKAENFLVVQRLEGKENHYQLAFIDIGIDILPYEMEKQYVLENHEREFDYSPSRPDSYENHRIFQSAKAFLLLHWYWREDFPWLMKQTTEYWLKHGQLSSPEVAESIPELFAFPVWENAIRLWRDSPEAPGEYHLFQSLQQIIQQSISTNPRLPESSSYHLFDYGAGKSLKFLSHFSRAFQSIENSPSWRLSGFDPLWQRNSRHDKSSNIEGFSSYQDWHQRIIQQRREIPDVLVCSRVVCTIEDDEKVHRIFYRIAQLLNLKKTSNETSSASAFIAICNPFHDQIQCGLSWTLLEESSEPAAPEAFENCRAWRKRVISSGQERDDYHRPWSKIQRMIEDSGLAVVRLWETPGVDLIRMEDASEYLIIQVQSKPVKTPMPSISILLKSCLMDVSTLSSRIVHIIKQLESAFPYSIIQERILVVDSRKMGFLRNFEPRLNGIPFNRNEDQNANSSAADDHSTSLQLEYDRILHCLLSQGLIDRIHFSSNSLSNVSALYQKFFGVSLASDLSENEASKLTHSISGVPVTSPLDGFIQCSGDYILQLDSNLMIGIDRNGENSRKFDLGEEIHQFFVAHKEALTLSLNIYHGFHHPFIPFTSGGHSARHHRVEVRGFFFHRQRLLASLPWRITADHIHTDDQPAALRRPLLLSWYRILDEQIRQAAQPQSWRGGSTRVYFIHPTNALKSFPDLWGLLIDAVERGQIPDYQIGQVDAIIDTKIWKSAEFSYKAANILREWATGARQRGAGESLHSALIKNFNKPEVESFRLDSLPWLNEAALLLFPEAQAILKPSENSSPFKYSPWIIADKTQRPGSSPQKLPSSSSYSNIQDNGNSAGCENPPLPRLLWNFVLESPIFHSNQLRDEQMIFVLVGRNVPPARFSRCFESWLAVLKGGGKAKDDCGAIIIDDSSTLAIAQYVRFRVETARSQGFSISLLQPRMRRGCLSNLILAVGEMISNPSAIVLTLDFDDSLIGQQIIARIHDKYFPPKSSSSPIIPAQMLISRMFRTDKPTRASASYEVFHPKEPRFQRSAGNVWSHLRSFRKYLFDQIPESSFRHCGFLHSQSPRPDFSQRSGSYYDLANDWSFMLPMAEMIRPGEIQFLPNFSYYYEPSRKVSMEDYRLKREKIIREIVQRPPMAQRRFLVSIVGSASLHRISPEAAEKIERISQSLGFELAIRGFAVQTGGGGGVMNAAASGAQLAYRQFSKSPSSEWRDSVTEPIAVLPVLNRSSLPCSPHHGVSQPTSLGFARNSILASADALVAIHGGEGTRSEIALAYTQRRPIVALQLANSLANLDFLDKTGLPEGGSSSLVAGRFLDDRGLQRHQRVFEARTVEESVEILEQLRWKARSSMTSKL